MKLRLRSECVFCLLAAAVSACALTSSSAAADLRATLPTGQALTPTAAAGARFTTLSPHLPALPDFVAGQASATALSPDGRTLLILTSGFNRNLTADGKFVPALSNEYVFVFDVSAAEPVQRQVLQLPNSFGGLAWAPDGRRFYVSGGVDDDVLEFATAPPGYLQRRTFPLHHAAGLGNGVKPEAGALAVSPSGERLLVANVQNDSVSIVDLAAGDVRELDLRPGSGRPGGTFPRAVAWTSEARAWVGSARDRQVIALDLSATPRVLARLAVRGQPSAMTTSRGGDRLYVALDDTDGVAAIDPARVRLAGYAPTGPSAGRTAPRLGGVGSNALALSPDGRTLYVADGGENAVALMTLDRDGAPRGVRGRVPTGWYPTGVAVSRDGARLYVVNGKSNPGPNPRGCRHTTLTPPSAEDGCRGANQYVWQLEKAGFLSLPTPDASALARLTAQVAVNNHVGAPGRAEDAAMIAFLRRRIRHVIYVVKENRTYDQILGDLEVGDGDPGLELFPATITPNHHRLARTFVDLDAFRDTGESSNTGWNWTTAGRTNDWTEREAPVNYAGRGLQYDQEGENRNVDVGVAGAAARHAARARTPADPDLLAGEADVAAPDGPDGDEAHGYLWNAARRAGLSVRNWGFYGDLSRYDARESDRIPLDREPWLSKRRVFYPTKSALAAVSDPYFRGFDQAFPDYWRVKEWRREFDGFARKGAAPTLMLVRLPHDHFGGFKDGIDGVDTVETEMADNDYAVGLLVETVAHSRFAADTLIFVVEDDAQDGADHVDAHRSVALVVGPYVKQGAVVSAAYDTVDMLRTIEGVLGLAPMNLNDARARPMTQVFDRARPTWTYDAITPPVLRTTRLPLPPARADETARARSLHDADYWARAMAGQDFSAEDRLDTPRFNAALWRGLHPERDAKDTPGR